MTGSPDRDISVLFRSKEESMWSVPPLLSCHVSTVQLFYFTQLSFSSTIDCVAEM